jgi:spore maturation protein CgeB
LPTSFDADILDRLRDVKQDISVSFIGGLSRIHEDRVSCLEALARKTPIKIWGYAPPFTRIGRIGKLLRGNTLPARYQGEVWGIEMYRIIKRSKITFNMHIAEAENLAGNMRMYEATGLGSLLISDFKSNTDEIFIGGREAVYYHSVDEAIEKIRYYLNHEDERMRIAGAGQKRTLNDYSFGQNSSQMLGYFKKYLN